MEPGAFESERSSFSLSRERIGLVLAPLQLVVRDTMHLVNAILTLLFFASPVLYRIESLPAALQPLAQLNPVAGLIGLYRAVVLGQPLSWLPVAVCVAATLACWTLGLGILRRLGAVLDDVGLPGLGLERFGLFLLVCGRGG